jgi:sirohydrochlorin cobaltochelatase
LKESIVLFAHGSRDPDWARPFQRISTELARGLPGTEIRLAYLEHMRPSLPEALAELAAAGVASVRVVPLFFGLGGHLRQDLPRLVAAADPRLKIVIDPPIGEQPAVIEAIAEAIARAARASP